MGLTGVAKAYGDLGPRCNGADVVGRQGMEGITMRLAAAAALALSLSACGPTYRNHGYVPVERELSLIQPGIDTRESVEAAIGRPATSGVERGDAWYYVQSRTRRLGPLAPRTIDRQLVAVSFSPSGTVQNIERFGLERGRVVTLSRRVTETTVRDYGLLRQLLGNFGRINVGQGLADEI